MIADGLQVAEGEHKTIFGIAGGDHELGQVPSFLGTLMTSCAFRPRHSIRLGVGEVRPQSRFHWCRGWGKWSSRMGRIALAMSENSSPRARPCGAARARINARTVPAMKRGDAWGMMGGSERAGRCFGRIGHPGRPTLLYIADQAPGLTGPAIAWSSPGTQEHVQAHDHDRRVHEEVAEPGGVQVAGAVVEPGPGMSAHRDAKRKRHGCVRNSPGSSSPAPGRDAT